MIRHIVLFRFKETEGLEARLERMKHDLEALPALIPELQELHAGINANPAEKWHLALEALTRDMKDLDTYARHPAHQQIVKGQIAPILDARACVDMEC